MAKEYIELEAAIRALQPTHAPAINEVLASVLRRVPTADVVEVRHGRWLSMDGDTTVSLDEFGCPTDSCRCSECGDWLTASDEYSARGRYCPNCGADMKEG